MLIAGISVLVLGLLAGGYYYYVNYYNKSSYKVMKEHDSSGNDIFHAKGATIDELKALCDADDKCLGFNSVGYVKSVVKPAEMKNVDLYIKQ